MNKRVNLIIGSGVLGAYLSAELLKKKEKVIVTSRSLNKNFINYKYLKIKNKVKFEKLNTSKKEQIEKIIEKYNPKKIFYFSGQSYLTKSVKDKKAPLRSPEMEQFNVLVTNHWKISPVFSDLEDIFYPFRQWEDHMVHAIKYSGSYEQLTSIQVRENPTTERSPTEELAIVKDTEIRQFYVR